MQGASSRGLNLTTLLLLVVALVVSATAQVCCYEDLHSRLMHQSVSGISASFVCRRGCCEDFTQLPASVRGCRVRRGVNARCDAQCVANDDDGSVVQLCDKLAKDRDTICEQMGWAACEVLLATLCCIDLRRLRSGCDQTPRRGVSAGWRGLCV